MSGPLETYFAELRGLIDEGLARALPDALAPPLILEAMRYSALGAGKRLRPCLTLAVADAVAARHDRPSAAARLLALPNACAVELVHAYSLVHDDLPAMDDDVLRRGRPTSHVVFGEGLAVLAGDGLLTEAFALITRSPSPAVPADAPVLSADERVRSAAVLAAAAGAAGMVGGQAIDLAAAGRVPPDRRIALDQPALEDMHARKTGALIRAAAVLGAIASQADLATTTAIDDYARHLGLVFQIVDDLLDVEGSSSELGKTAGKDAAHAKPSYPAFIGVDASKRLAAAGIDRAKAALASVGLGGRLADIATWSLARKH